MVTPFFSLKTRGAGTALGSGSNPDFSLQMFNFFFATRGPRRENAVADIRTNATIWSRCGNEDNSERSALNVVAG